ncbi:MAG: MBL fold metallo-hydrolase [Formosimonas sp.]
MQQKVFNSNQANRRWFLKQSGAAALGASLIGIPSAMAQTVSAEKKAAPASRLILLGTAGGPTPKPNRHASSHALVVNGSTYVIDCGDGVADQMIRSKVKPASTRTIFITHHHSDHNADWGNLQLLAWAADLNKPILSVGPPPLARMKQSFLQLNDFDIQTRIKDEGRKPLSQMMNIKEIRAGGLVYQDENVKVTAALNIHPPIQYSYAYRFDCPDRSIVFSGDTAYSQNVIDLARGADVLVHEVMDMENLGKLIATEPNAATLKEHLLASHTTVAEVGKVATQAGVKTLVLSHFVPGGYPFLSDEFWLNAIRPHFSGNIVIGKDGLEL